MFLLRNKVIVWDLLVLFYFLVVLLDFVVLYLLCYCYVLIYYCLHSFLSLDQLFIFLFSFFGIYYLGLNFLISLRRRLNLYYIFCLLFHCFFVNKSFLFDLLFLLFLLFIFLFLFCLFFILFLTKTPLISRLYIILLR